LFGNGVVEEHIEAAQAEVVDEAQEVNADGKARSHGGD
jgi:hypothetical protein